MPALGASSSSCSAAAGSGGPAGFLSPSPIGGEGRQQRSLRSDDSGLSEEDATNVTSGSLGASSSSSTLHPPNSASGCGLGAAAAADGGEDHIIFESSESSEVDAADIVSSIARPGEDPKSSRSRTRTLHRRKMRMRARERRAEQARWQAEHEQEAALPGRPGSSGSQAARGSQEEAADAAQPLDCSGEPRQISSLRGRAVHRISL